MPINFYLAKGQREQSMLGQHAQVYTIIRWHEETLRFVIIQLQARLYGIELASYAKSISEQLKQLIPSFSQLINWCNKIDPRAVGSRVLVGQIDPNTNKLMFQSSDSQIVWLIRQEKFYKMLVSQKGISGELLPGDQLIVGDQKLIDGLDNKTLSYKPIQNQLENILFGYHQDNKLLIISSPSKQRLSLDKLKKIFLSIKTEKPKPNNTTPIQMLFLKKPNIKYQGKREVTLAIAGLFLIALIISVSFGINKRRQLIQTQKEQQLIADITYRLEQAKSLQELNPTRSKTLLSEASLALNEYVSDNKLPSITLNNLKNEVASAYELVSGLIIVSQAPLFYDPNLLKDGFMPQQLSISDDELVLLDTQNKIAGSIDLQSKSAQIVAGSSQIQADSRLTTIPAWMFLLSGNKLAIIDKNIQKQIKSFTLTSTTVSDMVGYGNNLYILDVPAGQVLRFRGIKDSLAKAEDFFNEKQDLSGAVSLAIDGSIWILYSNGSVEKYTSGLRDGLYTDFNLDKPIQKADTFFTNENQNNIYILDKQQGRIVAISKQGEFKTEYTWENLKNCDGFVVSEKIGKILVLKDGKIWGINLK